MTWIDWPGLMRAGMGELHMTPEAFWKLSPIELRIMLGADVATPPLTRARLEELAAAFPDASKRASDDYSSGTTRSDFGT